METLCFLGKNADTSVKMFVIVFPFLVDKDVTDMLQTVVRRPGRVRSVSLYQMI
jgi:hypothetical protein